MAPYSFIRTWYKVKYFCWWTACVQLYNTFIPFIGQYNRTDNGFDTDISRGAWYGGYVLDFRPGGPGSIPGVDVNMN